MLENVSRGIGLSLFGCGSTRVTAHVYWLIVYSSHGVEHKAWPRHPSIAARWWTVS